MFKKFCTYFIIIIALRHDLVNLIENKFISMRNFVEFGGNYSPLCFFSFGATKSPKLSFGTFFALKQTRKAILDNIGFLSLVARGWQKSMDIIIKKIKISKLLCFYDAMYLK